MSPSQKVQAVENVGRTQEVTRMWTLCDETVMQKHHIDLLNADIAHMGHKRVALLCNSTTCLNLATAKKEFEAQLIKGPTTVAEIVAAVEASPDGIAFPLPTKPHHGFWSLYFSIVDLNAVWSNLISQCFFWGDQYASLFQIDLVTNDKNILRYNGSERVYRGISYKIPFDKKNLGFDTIARLIDRGEMDEDMLCCRLRVDLPKKCTMHELMRTGKRLLQTLPKSCRHPILYCPKDKTSEERISAVPTAVQQIRASTYRMCEEKVSIRTQKDGCPVVNVGRADVPLNAESQFIRDDNLDVDGPTTVEYVLYSGSGMVWKPCKRVK